MYYLFHHKIFDVCNKNRKPRYIFDKKKCVLKFFFNFVKKKLLSYMKKIYFIEIQTFNDYSKIFEILC